ncbi:MAG: reverse gyrase [Thermoplasmata archaeon]
MNSYIPESTFINTCPNCGKNINARRLFYGSVCEECISGHKEFSSPIELVENLKFLGKLKNLQWMENTINMLKDFEKLFKGSIGFSPSGIQRSWISRLSRGQSFGIVAPTGFGKTTFGLISSLYYFTKGKKSILIFQTRTLLDQSLKILKEYAEKLGLNPKIVSVHSGMKKAERIENENNFYSGNFDIAVFTGRYIMNNAEKITSLEYNLIFVDDIDSAIKTKKGVYSILKVIGFDENDISRIQEILKEQDDVERYRKLQEIKNKKLKDKIIIFSSATMTGGNKLITSVLGFRPGSVSIFLRNIIDYKAKLEDGMNKILNMVKMFKDGIIIFVSPEYGIEKAEEISKYLNKNGIKSLAITSKNPKGIEDFINGKVNVLVGVSSHNGLLVRGIDIPWRIKYSIFYGIPKFAIKIGEILPFQQMVRILNLIARKSNDPEISSLSKKMKKMLKNMSQGALIVLQKKIEEQNVDEDIKKAYEIVERYLNDPEFTDYMNKQTNFVIMNGWVMVPSHTTYIHASGRTSRLFRGQLTKGISIVLYENDALFSKFENKLKISIPDIEFKDFEKERIENLELNIREVEKDRDIMNDGIEKNVISSLSEMKHVLMVVESPTKARTISSFFGKPGFFDMNGIRIYETFLGKMTMMIVASQGHLFDLTTRPLGFYGIEKVEKDGEINFIPYYNSIKRCKNGHQVTDSIRNRCPKCGEEIVMDKINTIEDIRKLAFEVDEVFIGTDPDIEGEKIAWDIFLNIRPMNRNIKRVEFHEVTKEAILKAINSPREMDLNMIKAQLVRRIEDRWVGFVLSRKMQTVFWRFYCKKVGLSDKVNCKINKNLSAGRVQTPVLGWIVERTKEYYKMRRLSTILKIEGIEKLSFIIDSQVTEPIKARLKSIEYKINDMAILPPYTTDTLLTDASYILKFDVGKTMNLAQDLFELGLITYHRTDSTHVSQHGISIAKSYFKQIFGKDDIEFFKPRSWGESGTHECIRPTKPLDLEMLIDSIESGEISFEGRLTKDHLLLYNMIFKRFITSQIDNVKYEEENIILEGELNGKIIEIKNMEKRIVSVKLDDIDMNILKKFVYTPSVIKESMGESVKRMCMKECILQPKWNIYISEVNPYTEGELVRDMKNKKLGRPSTYSMIITNLETRKYVIKDKSKYLYSTTLGEEGYGYLINNYPHLVSETRTAKLYEEIDEIESGKRDYIETLKEIFDEISNSVKKAFSYRYYEI